MRTSTCSAGCTTDERTHFRCRDDARGETGRGLHTSAVLRQSLGLYRLQVAGRGVDYDCYYHSTEPPTQAAAEAFQLALNHADVLVGQNIKFDLQWIRECGFTYDGDIYDTMVAEYILSKARRWPLGLAALARKYGVTQKETDLIAPYLTAGKTFYDIPWEIVREYGVADVKATEEITLKQLDAFGVTFEELFDGKGLVPTLKLSLEMTDVLARTEQVGLKINMDTLDEIEQMYTKS